MTSLQDQLDEITSTTRELVQAERLAVSEHAVEELFSTGIEDHILPVDAIAPEFALNDASGRLVRSEDLLAIGPLIIKFFRGRWCPYCTTELEAWRDLYEQLRHFNALIVAISPQTVRQNDFLTDQHRLPFPVLSDPGCALAEKFGLAYKVPDNLRNYYDSVMIDLPSINGESSWRLPLPATYVIAKNRKVLFAEAYADFRVRPEPEDALDALVTAF